MAPIEPLPFELWTKIFKYLPQQDLLAICKTNLSFRDLAQSVLYYEVRLTTSDITPADLFTRSITERPTLAGFVHIFEFCDNNIEPHEDSHPILKSISLFRNLHVLVVESIDIDFDFYAALQTLPQLTSADFLHCAVSDALAFTDPPTTYNTILSKLSIVYPVFGEWWRLIPPGLRSLHLTMAPNDPDMAGSIFSPFVPSGLDKLTTLTLYDAFPANIVPLLIASPQLRRISLTASSLTDEICSSIPSLPSHTIPLLEDFTGWAEIAQEFIRGRPVHTAVIRVSITTPVNFLCCLQLSGVPVTKLELYGEPFTRDTLRYILTTLHHFGWRDNMSMSIEWYPSLSGISNLRALQNSSSTKIPFLEQEKMVHAASAACRGLSNFRFKAYYSLAGENSEETWLRVKDGGWCLVPTA